MKKTDLLLITIFIISCNHSIDHNQKEPHQSQHSLISNWDVKGVSGTYLIFDTKKLKIPLCDLQYLGQMKDSISGTPYFILSGRTSCEGDENMAIYIFTPSDTIKPSNQLQKYSYPGKETDYLTNMPIFESRLFLNRYTKEYVKSLTWVQKNKTDNGAYDNYLFIVDLFHGKVREQRIKEQDPLYKIEKTKILKYSEIQGIDVSSEP